MTFEEWLYKRLETEGWSLNELGRRAGVSGAALSMMLNGQYKPGRKMCTGIARAFNLPPEQVFRRAGLLPPKPEPYPAQDQALHLFLQLNGTQQDMVIAWMEMVIDRERRAERLPTAEGGAGDGSLLGSLAPSKPGGKGPNL